LAHAWLIIVAHWLAVEGVQPQIPQNPTTTETANKDLVAKGPNANPSLAALAGNDNVAFKPLVKHVLSKELILYFDKIRGAVLDEDPDEEVVRFREAAFASVRNDPGLHQLVPYFVQFIAEKVTHSLKSAFTLRQMLLLMEAMINNPTLYVDPYVSSLVPPVLTCLIGRRLGSEDTSAQTQFELRELAASLIGLLARKYAKSSAHIRPRLARTCLKHFLDPSQPLPVHYGAISGLSAVGGPETVRSLIIPNLKAYESVLQKGLSDGSERNRVAAEMVIGAIIKAVRTLTSEDEVMLTNGHVDGEEERKDKLTELVGEIIGSRITALGMPGLERAVLECRY
jgi:transcription initiation factor TFIID subunit 6